MASDVVIAAMTTNLLRFEVGKLLFTLLIFKHGQKSGPVSSDNEL